jgi:hypothetical protein
MIPYFAAAIIAVLAAAAFATWAMPRIQGDFSGGAQPVVSTVDLGDMEPLIDPAEYLLDPEDLVVNPLEPDDGLSYTGGGSP